MNANTILLQQFSKLPAKKEVRLFLLSFSRLGLIELKQESKHLEVQVQYRMSQLTTQVKRRDKLRHRRERQYNLITAILQASSQKRSKTYLFTIFQ